MLRRFKDSGSEINVNGLQGFHFPKNYEFPGAESSWKHLTVDDLLTSCRVLARVNEKVLISANNFSLRCGRMKSFRFPFDGSRLVSAFPSLFCFRRAFL
jgi:hypothetical protein